MSAADGSNLVSVLRVYIYRLQLLKIHKTSLVPPRVNRVEDIMEGMMIISHWCFARREHCVECGTHTCSAGSHLYIMLLLCIRSRANYHNQSKGNAGMDHCLHPFTWEKKFNFLIIWNWKRIFWTQTKSTELWTCMTQKQVESGWAEYMWKMG